MRWQDTVIGVAAVAALGALFAVSWRVDPSRQDTVAALYVAAGILEAAGVITTAVDLRAKARAAREFMQPTPPAADPRQIMVEQANAARGSISYSQLERIGLPLLAALDGRTLRVAAVLLLAGIAVGTAANILSVTA